MKGLFTNGSEKEDKMAEGLRKRSRWQSQAKRYQGEDSARPNVKNPL